MFSVLRNLNNLFVRTLPSRQAVPFSEEVVSEKDYNNYSFIISGRINYFNELHPALKQKYISRVHNYINGKEFHYIGLEQNEEIPILVSAAAVQVTLGLKNYRMQHFKNIYVLADAYRMDNDEELYIGHVVPDGIYISWKHFLYGYSDKSDNINVAIHEMSHALVFNNFFAQYGADKHFRLNYEKFSTTTGPILADVITSRKSYLRSYAFSNIHEFWAVSVEAFFENPDGLKENMPDLYDALCRVLNQDPLSMNKILKPELC
ncbi:MAG TPA: zinc-dependent peptidase [Chitinophagaceae bacterium]|nr:zinc-dependent peptidase [Chitinophagaceae bacterium]